MNTYKKTLFLSNKDNPQNKSMGILTLEKKNRNIYCSLKTYNFDSNHDLVLGIKTVDQIIKQNIILSNSSYNFLINQDIELSQIKGCVLLECDKNNIEPKLWGNEKNLNYKSQIVNNLKSSILRIQSEIKEIKPKKPENSVINNIDTSKQEPSSSYSPINSKETYEIHKNEYNINNYHNDIIYSQISLDEEILNSHEIAQASMEALFESDDNEINEEINKNVLNPNGAEHKFYNMIADQLEELFDKFPRENTLEKLIDNSKWIRINHEEENKYYVVGIIYQNDDIKYICYGVPGNYYNEPPIELRNYSQWLPTDAMNPYEFGYWTMYQDADTGENVFLN